MNGHHPQHEILIQAEDLSIIYRVTMGMPSRLVPKRFNGTVLDEFFRLKMRETFYESVQALQEDLDEWLDHYNTERPHLGYRNQGRRPLETVKLLVSQEG